MATKRKAAKGGLKAARTMPGKRSAGRRGPKLGARAAKRNASLQAMLQNEPVRTGVGSARAAYGRLSRRGKGAEDLVKDRKARRDLGRGAHSFGRLQPPYAAKRSGGGAGSEFARWGSSLHSAAPSRWPPARGCAKRRLGSSQARRTAPSSECSSVRGRAGPPSRASPARDVPPGRLRPYLSLAQRGHGPQQ